MRADIDEEHAGLNALLLKGVRSRVAINHFKRCILGDLHVAGRAQSKSLFEALEDLVLECEASGLKSSPRFDPLRWLGFVSSRAWEGWYGSPARVPQPGTLRALDQAAARLIRWRRPADGVDLPLPNNFYVTLVHGGLLQTMLAPTEAAEPGVELLRSRAANYCPVSAWHLHLDALEIRAYTSDFKSVPWSEVVGLGGRRGVAAGAESAPLGIHRRCSVASAGRHARREAEPPELVGRPCRSLIQAPGSRRLDVLQRLSEDW